MSNTPKRFIIVDGHAMAYRAFYALQGQNLTDSKGNPTETIFGFFRMLGKYIKDLKPDYFVTAFDFPAKTFRHKKYSFYKANRSPTPEPLKAQIRSIYQIFEKLSLPMISIEGYEADDIIFTLANVHRSKDLEINIISGDKDLFALLDDTVHLLRPQRGASEFRIMNGESVVEEIGVKPEQVFEFMALTGDTADNVPGVKGVGSKTAAKLIKEYGTLENIYKNVEDVRNAKLKEKLIQDKENAFVSLDLVTLRNFEFENKLDGFIWNKDNLVSNSVSIFREYELTKLYEEWSKLFGNKPTASEPEPKPVPNKEKNSAPANQPETKTLFESKDENETEASKEANNENTEDATQEQFLTNITLVRTKSEWEKFEKQMLTCSEIAIDTETTSVDPMRAQLVGASFAWSMDGEKYAIYIPVMFDTQHEYHLDYQDMAPGEEVLEWIKPILENEQIKKTGQNIKYDALVLQNHNVEIKAIQYDTMVISFLLDPNSRKHGLDDLSFQYLHHNTIKYSDIAGSGKKARPLVQVPLEDLVKYAGEDAEIAYRLKETLYPLLEKENLLKLYDTIDLPMVTLLKKMQLNGVCIDTRYLQTLDTKYQNKLDIIQAKIHELADEVFNINSTKELQRILFEKLEIKSKKKTPKGALSTQASVLENLRDQHPIIDEILHHRTLTKLLTTYIHTLPGFILPTTKRVHTSLSQTIAATGRLASSEPNLQNIPIKGEDGAALRKAFIAPKGYSLLSLDYSQIELRILAHYSEDEHLVRAYENDEDIHDQAAYLLFHKYFNPDDNTWSETALNKTQESFDASIMKKMKQTPEFVQKRSQAKVLNFSIAYGVTQYGLARSLNIAQDEAKELIQQYFASFPGIKKYMDRTIAAAQTMRYSINFFGRKRKVDNINDKNRFLREAAERLAINNPIQSTAADLIKVAMLHIQNELERLNMKTKMILQIHDELLFEVPDNEKDSAFSLIQNSMENAIQLDVPLKVTGGFGQNWQEAK
ncbi:MAG: DNA polymerase I [Leptospirales bacterium]